MRAMLRLLTAVLAAIGGVQALNPATVRVMIMSQIEEDVVVYWVNTWKEGLLVRQKEDALPGRGSLNVDSFNTHSFLIVEDEHASKFTHYTKSMWDPKIMTLFTMGEFDLEVRITRNDDGYLVSTPASALTRTTALMEKATAACRNNPAVLKAASERMSMAVAEGSCPIGTPRDFNEMIPEFKECLTQAIASDLAKKETEANKSMRMLEAVGDRARNYTCVDPEMETTKDALSTTEWKDPAGGLTYKAQVFLDEPSAKIMLLDNFATDEECEALKASASPHLKDATVNGGGGTSTLSNARRAKAGGVAADLDNPKSKTRGLYRRGYDFANFVTGYNMQFPGQEGFSVIKYGSSDEYRPHCDGDCTGAPHMKGGRVATMVIYCEQAEVGGGTTFSSSDVFINGKKGQAAFFSYLGPDGRTDIGRTRHSGCPILKGTKWIATLWMRLGVTEEMGWQYYDPSGMTSAFGMNMKKAAVKAKREGADSNDSSTATAAKASGASKGGDTQEGVLNGISGTISSMFSGGAKS